MSKLMLLKRNSFISIENEEKREKCGMATKWPIPSRLQCHKYLLQINFYYVEMVEKDFELFFWKTYVTKSLELKFKIFIENSL